MSSAPDEPYSVVLFDGQCNLCNSAVRFIVRRDPRGRFRFASLRSDLGRAIAGEHGRADVAVDNDTILLLEAGRLFDRSTAALRIAAGLRAPWPLLAVFLAVPAPLRDLVYRWIARNRYRWFGKTEECMLPTAALRGQFLTD